MALGTNKNQGNNNKLIILKLSRKDKDNGLTYFKVTEKNSEGKWEESTNTSVSDVGGTVTKVEVKREEYKGKPYEKYLVYLQDDSVNETYLLDLRLNNATRGLFNSLLNLETYENIVIEYAENKKGFETLYVKQNGEVVDWKFSLDQQPKGEEINVKSEDGTILETKVSYHKLEKFYKEQIDVLSKAVAASRANKVREEVVTQEDSENSDDIPF